MNSQQPTISASALLLFALLFTSVSALAQCPFGVSLIASKSSYLEGESIKLELRVTADTATDTSGANIIARNGVFNQDFHLKLTFIAADGEVIRFTSRSGGVEPGPPLCIEGQCNAVQAEVIPLGAQTTTVLDDANTFYNLGGRFGPFQAFFSFPVDFFSTFIQDAAGERFSRLNDPGGGFCDPARSNTVAFDIVPLQPIASATVRASLSKIVISGKGARPGVTKLTPENVPVRLYRSSTLTEFEPVNHKTFSLIWNEFSDVAASALTDAQGIALIPQVAQDDYRVISCFPGSSGFVCTGSRINASDPDWSTGVITVRLRVIETPD